MTRKEQKEGQGGSQLAERSDLFTLGEEMDRLLASLMQGFASGASIHLWGRPSPWPTEPWMPALDIFQRNGSVVVRVDLPGMKREEIQVTVEEDVLVVQGERKEAEEAMEGDYRRVERATGRFYRALRLPAGVDGERVTATYQDGVLEITVPCRPVAASKPCKVAIK